MNNIDIKNKLTRLNEEDIIWLVYFFIITFAVISNYYERIYLSNNNKIYLDKYKNINTTIFIIAVIIYLYYLKNTYEDYNNNRTNDNLSLFIGSSLFFIAGLIYLFIDIKRRGNLDELYII